jgi:hypothetical protein
MRNLLWKLLSVAVLMTGLLILIAPPARADGQSQCQPITGTLYMGLTDTWYMVGDLTIGKKVYHATGFSVNTSFIDEGDVWLGTETWTFDFGGGNTIQVMAQFVTEHMTDAASESGIYHYIGVGTFANGTGAFKRAHGNLGVQGPFGPNVKVPDNVKLQLPADAVWFAIMPAQGMIGDVQ